MTTPKPRASQFDLFIPLMRDLPLKDQRETMERPFFSLQKRKRLKPIEYLSPDGEVRVKVEAVPGELAVERGPLLPQRDPDGRELRERQLRRWLGLWPARER